MYDVEGSKLSKLVMSSKAVRSNEARFSSENPAEAAHGL